MEPSKPSTARGRPRTITRERIVEAGIKIGLPNITFVGVAAEVGVSHMALYKHVANLEALKHLVAEEIFTRWQLPEVPFNEHEGLKSYLMIFTSSVRTFVKAHPGLTPYVIRRMAATEPMLAKIKTHQAHVAQAFQMEQEDARWLLATIAFHSICVADTIYSITNQEPTTPQEQAELETEFSQGMHALIVGALALIKDGGHRGS